MTCIGLLTPTSLPKLGLTQPLDRPRLQVAKALQGLFIGNAMGNRVQILQKRGNKFRPIYSIELRGFPQKIFNLSH